MNIRLFITLITSLLVLVSCGKKEDPPLSLAGEWKFELDPGDLGTGEKWYSRDLSGKISLPGSLQNSGYGDDISPTTAWTGEIKKTNVLTAPVYATHNVPGDTKVPFWLQPDKHYTGAAWYQTELVLPQNDSGEWLLELERPHWETTVYLDDTPLGTRNSLGVPHRYLIKGASPGKHRLTIRVDNRVKIPVGINAHSVSDHTQTNWNGIAGQITVASLPKARVEHITIHPNIDKKSIKITASITKQEGSSATLSLDIINDKGVQVGNSRQYTMSSGEQDKTIIDTLPLYDNAVLWSEHSPQVYYVRSTITSGEKTEVKKHSFGLREWQAKGTRFELNKRPIFLRGTLECCVFPLTGYPSTQPEYWEKIYGACKEYGLNHVRFHSWCPPRAAFDAADKMGIYLQVECGVWSTVGENEQLDNWIREEGLRILKEYGNHPSFLLMAHGNEPGGGKQADYLTRLIDTWRKTDDRHAYNGAAGWPYLGSADFWNPPDPRIQAWGQGLNSRINALPPSSDFDFRDIIKKEMPTISHEIGQWCVYPDFKEIAKYTGSIKAKNFELFQEILKNKGMQDMAEPFLYASGRLQTLCYKADIEAALRTPGMAGFQLLGLNDFPGQGTALVGSLNAFWESKGYVDGKEYSTFCSDTVPLVRLPKMIWNNTETLRIPVEAAHFGELPLENARFEWKITGKSGTPLASGHFQTDVAQGNVQTGNTIDFPLTKMTSPEQLEITVSILSGDGNEIQGTNSWRIWVYPETPAPPKNLPYMTHYFDQETRARLAKGEKVLLSLKKGTLAPEYGGKIAVGFSSIFWNTAWTNHQAPHTLGLYCKADHPALASFPNNGYSDYQWWDIVKDSHALVLDDFPKEFRPIIHHIDDWFVNRKLGLLLEVKVLSGSLLICTSDLETNLDQRPSTRQFRQSLLEYMDSPQFNPQTEIPEDLLKKILPEK